MSIALPSLDFCQARVRLTWGDFLWALEKGIFSWKDAIAFAISRLQSSGDGALPEEIELAGLDKDSAGLSNDLVRILASVDHENLDFIKQKWLFLLLAWLYEKRTSITNPLSEVERIYADFDYPQEIESFVPYMPVTEKYDPKKHSAAENQARLMAHWKNFLDRQQQRFGAV